MPIMGYSYGARNKKRLLSALKYGCIIAVIIMAVGMVIFMTIPELLLMIFNATDEILAIGVPALRTISLCFMAAAIGIMFSTLFQALGLGFNSLLVSLLRQIIILLPAAYLLSKISLDAVWYAFVIAEFFSLIASILIYWGVYRKRIRNLQ